MATRLQLAALLIGSLGGNLGLPTAATADPLGDLSARLRSPAAAVAIVARVTVRVAGTADDDGDTTSREQSATVDATLDATGLRLSWSAAQLAEARRADAARRRQPDAPERTGLADLEAEEVVDWLDAAPPLLLLLEGAELVASRPATFSGQPATLLELTPRSVMSTRDRKRVKQHDDTLKIWLDSEGRPLGMERKVHIKASILLLSFTQDQHLRVTYGTQGDRLYAAHREEESAGKGMGQAGTEKTVVTVTPVAAAGDA